MYERILAVGDIHGEWDKFMYLYRMIEFDPEKDLLIFLGDYIDRGLKPLHVLDWMYEHQNEKNIIMLRGNHEQLMLDYYAGGEKGDLWLWNGGDVTRRGLKKQNTRVRDLCLEFVSRLPVRYRIQANGKDFFFCHAGVKPGIPLKDQEDKTLLWVREEFFDHYSGKEIVVSGHTNVGYVEPGRTTPILRKNMILVDTGSYLPDGQISCVDVLSGRIWQSE